MSHTHIYHVYIDNDDADDINNDYCSKDNQFNQHRTLNK